MFITLGPEEMEERWRNSFSSVALQNQQTESVLLSSAAVLPMMSAPSRLLWVEQTAPGRNIFDLILCNFSSYSSSPNDPLLLS